MANTMTIREGWTERIRYRLTRNSPAVVMDLTGMSIALVGKDTLGNPLAFTGTVGSDDPTGGAVYFDPSDDDLVALRSPFYVRWEVTDTSNKSAFFPRSNPITWIVQAP